MKRKVTVPVAQPATNLPDIEVFYERSEVDENGRFEMRLKFFYAGKVTCDLEGMIFTSLNGTMCIEQTVDTVLTYPAPSFEDVQDTAERVKAIEVALERRIDG